MSLGHWNFNTGMKVSNDYSTDRNYSAHFTSQSHSTFHRLKSLFSVSWLSVLHPATWRQHCPSAPSSISQRMRLDDVCSGNYTGGRSAVKWFQENLAISANQASSWLMRWFHGFWLTCGAGGPGSPWVWPGSSPWLPLLGSFGSPPSGFAGGTKLTAAGAGLLI